MAQKINGRNWSNWSYNRYLQLFFFWGAHFAGGLGFWEDDGRGILSARETEMMGNTMNRQLGHNNDNFGKVNYYE